VHGAAAHLDGLSGMLAEAISTLGAAVAANAAGS